MPAKRSKTSQNQGVSKTLLLERPVQSRSGSLFGSDAVAETLRDLGIPYIALTPGASFRGLHDSLVNHLGNKRPRILLCLREDHAVGIAHGYAKVTGRLMAAAVHSNVGLFNAAIAIFNAWCDRMPVMVIGATGPVDATLRRPWVDWIHTARDQGAVVRGFTKWDDQPASVLAAREALLRAAWIASTAPTGPVYVNLDAGMQESGPLDPPPPLDIARFVPPVGSAAPEEALRQAARLLTKATRSIILAGRVSRSMDAWNARVRLAELLGAQVVTDLKVGAAFPTDHPAHIAQPSSSLTDEARKAVKGADVVLSLDWVDLAGTLRLACENSPPKAKIIQVSMDHAIHSGWNMDYQALPTVDLMLAAHPDDIVRALIKLVPRGNVAKKRAAARPRTSGSPNQRAHTTIADLGRALRTAVGKRPVSLLHLPIYWDAKVWPFSHPLDFIGSNGGGGVGGGPGIAVGAALALRDTGRLPIAITGDGDFLMGATAVWTAVHYRIPLLIAVANNNSFFNDEMHQQTVALARGRPAQNRWIGQRISDPDIDIASIARAQGARGYGPVRKIRDLSSVFERAILDVQNGLVAVVDIRIKSDEEYAAAMPGTARH